jgi:hypothetical protein
MSRSAEEFLEGRLRRASIDDKYVLHSTRGWVPQSPSDYIDTLECADLTGWGGAFDMPLVDTRGIPLAANVVKMLLYFNRKSNVAMLYSPFMSPGHRRESMLTMCAHFRDLVGRWTAGSAVFSREAMREVVRMGVLVLLYSSYGHMMRPELQMRGLEKGDHEIRDGPLSVFHRKMMEVVRMATPGSSGTSKIDFILAMAAQASVHFVECNVPAEQAEQFLAASTVGFSDFTTEILSGRVASAATECSQCRARTLKPATVCGGCGVEWYCDDACRAASGHDVVCPGGAADKKKDEGEGEGEGTIEDYDSKKGSE